MNEMYIIGTHYFFCVYLSSNTFSSYFIFPSPKKPKISEVMDFQNHRIQKNHVFLSLTVVVGKQEKIHIQAILLRASCTLAQSDGNVMDRNKFCKH